MPELLIALAFIGQLQIVPAAEEPRRVEVRATLAADAWPTNSATALPADPARWLSLTQLDASTQRSGAPLFGDFRRDGEWLVFQPSFPLLPGSMYRATALTRDGAKTAEYQVTRNEAPIPRVTAIYPSSEVVPENLLKFYLHFSEPMREGRSVFERVRIEDDQGRLIPDPWRTTELWNSEGTRLTLWIHPGRVKQGVNLRDDEGPVLVAGGTYRLIVSREFRSAAGQSIQRDVVKRLRVTPADHEPPSVDRWRPTLPRLGTRDPLIVQFDEPLDRHLLDRSLRVELAGEIVPGRGEVSGEERLWTWTPLRPWRDAQYRCVADALLEDLAGNTPGEPFEVDLQAAVRPQAKDESFAFRPRQP